MVDAVLNASAVLALINGEPGADVVGRAIGRSAISVVNEAEVVAVLIRQGKAAASALMMAGRLPYHRIDADAALARRAGALLAETGQLDLSLGDRFCLALAARERLPAITADRSWAKLDLGIEIRLVRP